VITSNIFEDLGKSPVALLQRRVGNDLAEPLRLSLVDKDVGVFCRGAHIVPFYCIAADDDRSSFVIETVSNRRLDRLMTHFEGRHLQTIGVKNDLRLIARRRHADFEGPRDQRRGLNWGDIAAMMCGTIAVIKRVGFVNAGDDSFNAGTSVDPKQSSTARNPSLQTELSKIAEVIGMEMGEHYTGDPLAGEPHQRQCLPAFWPCVDDVGPPASDDENASLGTFGIG